MNRVEVSNLAETDLLNIYLYGLEIYGRDAALAYAASLHETFSLLARFPRMGRTARGISPPCRRHEHREHIIFYEERAEGVFIIRLLHRAQLKRVPL